MISIFESYTYAQALRLLGLLDKGTVAAGDFYKGDHWQRGNGWIGPRPADSDGGTDTLMAEIARGFVSKNVAREVVDRHTNAIIGREPNWSLTLVRDIPEGGNPSSDEQFLIDEADSLLTSWWDDQKVLLTLQHAVHKLLWGGTGVLRLFVPAGSLVENDDTGMKAATRHPMNNF